MNLIPLTRMKDAKEKICPFDLASGERYPMTCKVEKCMAWIIVRSQTAFEDHSGGKERAKNLAKKYNVLVERNDIKGSEGLWFVGPLGYCKRLWPMAENVSTADYEVGFDPSML